jgi:ribose/xylose/arabinose/galactoside ABC-type transport system permease subunit
MGLAPRKVLASAFAVGALFFGLAVLVYATRVQSIEPARMALGFELQVIAAVILGGTNIFGGEGSYLGTLLGALFLYLVSQVLVYASASAYLQEAITGGIILAVIGIDCALHRKAKLMEELA